MQAVEASGSCLLSASIAAHLTAIRCICTSPSTSPSPGPGPGPGPGYSPSPSFFNPLNLKHKAKEVSSFKGGCKAWLKQNGTWAVAMSAPCCTSLDSSSLVYSCARLRAEAAPNRPARAQKRCSPTLVTAHSKQAMPPACAVKLLLYAA